MMAHAIINRALSNIGTELEFIAETEVITYELCKKILEVIPNSYTKNMVPWGVEKLSIGNDGKLATNNYPDNFFDDNPLDQDASGEMNFEFKNAPGKMKVVNVDVSPELSNHLQHHVAPITPPSQISHSTASHFSPLVARLRGKPPIGYCQAIENYHAEREEDITISLNEKMAIVEQLSSDWYLGYKKLEPEAAIGVFPAGYVKLITEEQYLQSPLPSPEPSHTHTPSSQTVFDPAILKNTGQIENTNPTEAEERRLLTPDPSPSIHQKEIFPPVDRNLPRIRSSLGRSSLQLPKISDQTESALRGALPMPNSTSRNIQKTSPPSSRSRAILANSQQLDIKKVPGFHLVQSTKPSSKAAQPEQPVFISPEQPLQEHQNSEKRLSSYMNQNHVQTFSGQQMRQYAEPTPPKKEKKELHFKLFGKK